MSQAVRLPLPTEPATRLPEALARVEHDEGRVVVTREGKPVAALVSLDDLNALEDLDAQEDAHWERVADERIDRWEAEGRPPGVSLEDLLVRYGIDPEQP